MATLDTVITTGQAAHRHGPPRPCVGRSGGNWLARGWRPTRRRHHLLRGPLRSALQRNCFLTSALFAVFAACVTLRVHIGVLYGLCACLGYSFSGVWGSRPLGHSCGCLARGHQPHRRRQIAISGPRAHTCSGIVATSEYLWLWRSAWDLDFGTFESNVPQRMPQYGLSPDLGGLFLVLLDVGSMTGGIYVSLRPIGRQHAALKAAALLAVFAVLMLPSVLASSAGTYAGCLLFASIMLVPLNGLGTSELEARIGQDQRAEAFSSYQAATMTGGGLGTVLNGVLVGPAGAWNAPYLSIGLFLVLAATLAVAVRGKHDLLSQLNGERNAAT